MALVREDGRYAGSKSSGKALFKFASGTLAALSGKVVKFETESRGAGRFSMALTTDSEVSAMPETADWR